MAQFPSFAESLTRVLQAQPETGLHPHSPSERADEFHAVEPGAAELEVLNLLNALVYFFKPSLILETGTGSGLSALAMLAALAANGSGHLHTVDIDPGVTERARQRLGQLDASCLLQASFHSADSLAWIESTGVSSIDFVFFDSLIAFRHLELQKLLDLGKLSPGAVCVFHDTSRARGQYYEDFNPEMIAALDEASAGRQWLESGLSRGLRILKLG